jgi:DNA-binding Lrp family transcriptional regulator
MWTNPHNTALLARLQQGVPLRRDPLAAIAAEVGLDADDVLARLARWERDGLLREVSALFDATALGYHTALIAQRPAPQELDAAAERAAGHPGVSHCYLREGRYNLWFTLAVSPTSRLGLPATADRLARAAANAPTLILPARKKYKLRLNLPAVTATDASSAPPQQSARPAGAPSNPSESEQSTIRLLQRPLPLARDPWEQLAAEGDLSTDELLAEARRFHELGWLRRVSAFIRHTRAGARVNVLVAWRVEENCIDDVGQRAASESAVSHCYRRPARPDWPYELYTMVHGRDVHEVRGVLRRIGERPGVADSVELPTVREVKKQRLKLFTKEEARWESRIAPDA